MCNKLIGCSNLEKAFCQTVDSFPSWESAFSNNIGCLKLEVMSQLKLKVTDCLSLDAVTVISLSSKISKLNLLAFLDFALVLMIEKSIKLFFIHFACFKYSSITVCLRVGEQRKKHVSIKKKILLMLLRNFVRLLFYD